MRIRKNIRKNIRRNIRSKKKTKKIDLLGNIKKFFYNLFIDTEEEIDEKKNTVVVEKNNGFNTKEVIIVVIIAVFFGFGAGYTLCSSKPEGIMVSDEINELVSTYENILDGYYGEVNEKELLDAAVEGMIETLNDPNSYFMSKNETESFNQTVEGSFIGVGITIMYCDDIFQIIDVLPNSPASKADIAINDYIVEVAGKNVEGLSMDEVSDLIQGKIGSKVKMVLKRGEELVEVTVKRDKVVLTSVFGRKISGTDVGYIQIQSFASNTFEQFEKKLTDLEKDKINSLIIDVRGNPGGKLSSAADILDLFLGKNKVLYRIETKDKVEKVYSKNKEKRSYPIVVLTDCGSASAAEILAVSLQENYNDVRVVGTSTYGKGTIQKAFPLSSGSTVKYTTQKWLTPKGEWLNDIGVTPDIIVEQSELYYETQNEDDDAMLQKAIELLKK